MKKIWYIILLSIGCWSCEEEVDVDLQTEAPRLVVEASINWLKETDGRLQRISLTQTAAYFDNQIPAATGAIVYIENTEGERFDFLEEGSTGVYVNDSFEAQLHMTYSLHIQYQQEVYQAQETLIPVSDLSHMTQNNGTVFGNDYVELKAYFNDPADQENYYFYKFESENDQHMDALEDRLVNGNEMFAIFVSENLHQNDEVQISLFGASEQYYHYIHTLIAQPGESNGPFQTQPATVKGNIINLTNPENFALGYFRVSQADSYTYILE